MGNGKPGKAVNRAEIPSAVWRKSESSLKVLWKLMRVMWVRMSEESEDDQIPEDWIDATLVCLYKGKGSRLDPKMYVQGNIFDFVNEKDFHYSDPESHQKLC